MGLGVGLVYDARMLAHENEIDMAHPEKPARISSIYKRLRAAGVVDRCILCPLTIKVASRKPLM